MNMENNGIGGARSEHVVQQFVPSAAWTEDSNGHYLLIDLPEFKKEEVKLQVDNSSHITVSGQRMVANNNRCIFFEQKHEIPENSDIDKITGKFDGEILYVTVPKLEKVIQEPSTHQTMSDKKDDAADHLREEEKTKIGDYSDPVQRNPYFKKALEVIRRNKGFLVTAVIAFSIGVLVARSKFESDGEIRAIDSLT